MGRMRPALATVVAALVALPGLFAPAAADIPPPRHGARVVRWDGPIGPVAARYLERQIGAAEKAGAGIVVIGIDTPGGLDTSMREIVRAIHDSRVPIAVWVGPSGSRAASAGCVIALSAPILAMAPGTNIGAAHPVPVGGGTLDSTMAEKVANDAAAYVESLARERGRNVEWARNSVEKSVSASAEEAVRLGIADFLAADIRALLKSAEGRTVRVHGEERTVENATAPVVTIERDWRTGFLAALNDPNVAYILLLLGVYGLFFELATPGAMFPGIFGVISLILGLYSLANLPVNWAGFLLILAGVIMLLLEIKIVSHGLLAVGGIASLVIGSLLLFDSPVPAFRLSLSVLLPSVIVTAAFFLWLVGKGMAAQRRPPATGAGALVGRSGEARTRLAPEGTVFVEGTHWNARADGVESIEVDRRIRVVGVEGLLLRVRPED